MFNSWGTATLFSVVVIVFYISTRVWFQFLHLLTNTCYFLCLYSVSTDFVSGLLGVRAVLGEGCRGTGPGCSARARAWRQETVAAGDV